MCNTGDCETCAGKIFKIHLNFFEDEFKKKLEQQHGEAAVCRDAQCKLCHLEEVVCPGKDCHEKTGSVRTGVLACEIFQVHPSNAQCSALPGPVKRCCKMHVKSWLICSYRCLESSKYAKAIPAGDKDAFEALFAKRVFGIPDLGPLLVTDHYAGGEASVEDIASACAYCYRFGATKICSACRSVRYCTRDCQKLGWAKHKTECRNMGVPSTHSNEDQKGKNMEACD